MIRPKPAGQPDRARAGWCCRPCAPPACDVRRASPRYLSPRQVLSPRQNAASSALLQEASDSPSCPARPGPATRSRAPASRVRLRPRTLQAPVRYCQQAGHAETRVHAHCRRGVRRCISRPHALFSLWRSFAAGAGRRNCRCPPGEPGIGRIGAGWGCRATAAALYIARPSPAISLAAAGRSDPPIAMLAGISPDQTPSPPVGPRTFQDRLGRMTGSCARARRSCAIARPASATSGAKSTRATRTTCSASVLATGSTLFGTGTARHGCSRRSGARPAIASAAHASRMASQIAV
jgi:hypothetical protein